MYEVESERASETRALANSRGRLFQRFRPLMSAPQPHEVTALHTVIALLTKTVQQVYHAGRFLRSTTAYALITALSTVGKYRPRGPQWKVIGVRHAWSYSGP